MMVEISFVLKSILKIIVFITLVNFLRINQSNKILMSIILLSVVNTVMASVFIYYHISIKFITNIYVIASHSLWIFLLIKTMDLNKINVLIVSFVIFSLLNLFLFEGVNKFNTKSFVGSALIYLVIFIYSSFSKIKKEDLVFFSKNEFILIVSPVIYFVGFSFMFGFKNRNLNDISLLKGLTLFDFISFFVNIVLYGFINVYIFKERKVKNAT